MPKTDFPVLNLFLLYMLPAIFFSDLNIVKRFIILVIFIISTNHVEHSVKSMNKNIAIIQVGLYFQNGGRVENFYHDLSEFIEKNKADIILFSENVYFGFKNDFIKRSAVNLINDITHDSKNYDRIFVLNFFGFEYINNVVSVIIFHNQSYLHQKSVLIPFLEKRGVWERNEMLSSEYLSKKRKSEFIDVNKITHRNFHLKTYICFEAIFPEFFLESKYFTVIQSDYSAMNKGRKFRKTVIYGSVMSKFSVAINSPMINIQNYGGSVFFSQGWNIDWKTYKKSLTEPFVIVHI